MKRFWFAPIQRARAKNRAGNRSAARFRVVLLMGDNLNDFSDVFENAKTVTARMTVTDQNKARFGSSFIVLPNPMYGDWETHLRIPKA